MFALFYFLILPCCFHSYLRSAEGIPDPIKLIRRLSALEISVRHLKRDCEIIARRRGEVVQSVLETQQQNVAKVQEIFGMVTVQEASIDREKQEKEEWEELASQLAEQSST
jgi:hypothetical protein